MTLVRDIAWDTCLLRPQRDPEIVRDLRREIGTPVGPGCFYFAAAPWMPSALARLNRAMLDRTHLDRDLIDWIGLVVSQESSCRYCFATQRAMRIGMGTSPAEMDRLERDFLVAARSDRERAALEFTRRVARANPLATGEDRDVLLRAGFSEDETREILVHIALGVFFNRLSTQSALPPQPMERMPDKWHLRLLQPLIAIRLRRMRTKRAPATLGPIDGPFAPVLRSFDGLHAAPPLRDFVDQLWRSEDVPRRGLALVFAVVARALGCRQGEASARALVIEEGMAPEALARVLDHLDGPELDRFEQVALPYARETAWVQAAQVTRLQRLARDAQAKLGEAEFVTLLGATSMANALCRVGATLPAD